VGTPRGFLQQQVDEEVTGFGFGVVVRIRLRGTRLFCLGGLGAQALEFLVQRGLVRQ